MPEHKQSNASEKEETHIQKLKTFGGVSSTEN